MTSNTKNVLKKIIAWCYKLYKALRRKKNNNMAVVLNSSKQYMDMFVLEYTSKTITVPVGTYELVTEVPHSYGIKPFYVYDFTLSDLWVSASISGDNIYMPPPNTLLDFRQKLILFYTDENNAYIHYLFTSSLDPLPDVEFTFTVRYKLFVTENS